MVGIQSRTNNEIRRLVLDYLHVRNQKSRSARTKSTGAAVSISIMRKELKDAHGLNQNEIRRNLTYLLSQGWVDEQVIEKSVPVGKTRMIVPSSTSYYIISAQGIDKIEGQGEFTLDRFSGIKIEATGQNIITVGDGNQVNAQFSDLASDLADLRAEIRRSTELSADQQVDAIADIDTIQSQLAKPQPDKTVLQRIWKNIEATATAAGLSASVVTIAQAIAAL